MPPDLLGLSSMATRHALAVLAAECPQPITFEAGGGVRIADEVRAGRACDVVVLSDDAMAGLRDEGHVIAGSVRPVFHSDAVLAMPAGNTDAPLNTAEDLHNLLAAAQRIGYSTGPSGTAFGRVMADLGIPADKLVQAEAGVPVAELVRDRQVDVGVQQLSEMHGTPGISILGPLPEPHAIRSTFTAGVATASQNTEAAQSVVDFIASPEHAALAESHGLTLITAPLTTEENR